MDYQSIFSQLEENGPIFRQLLSGISSKQYSWKQHEEKWSLLEVICHLHDEEREDFRIRLQYVLQDPQKDPPKINPVDWVKERKYMEQDYQSVLSNFLEERKRSVSWLRSLKDPLWDNAYEHPRFGKMSAHMYLVNWLAHDYLHIKQITRLKYDYLKEISDESLVYAGEWK